MIRQREKRLFGDFSDEVLDYIFENASRKEEEVRSYENSKIKQKE